MSNDEQAMAEVPKSQLADVSKIEVGMQLQAETPEGPRIVTVAEVSER